MARVALKQCDTPASALPGKRPCPYCDANPKEVATLQRQPSFAELVRDRALNLPILQNPPDLLHLVARVVAWMLDITFNHLHSAHPRLVGVQSESAYSRKWLATHGGRTAEGPGTTVGTQGVMHAFLRGRSWSGMLTDAANRAEQLSMHDGIASFDALCAAWSSLQHATDLMLQRSMPDTDSILQHLNSFGTSVSKLSAKKTTPSAHIWLHHLPYFVKRTPVPLWTLTTHGTEGVLQDAGSSFVLHPQRDHIVGQRNSIARA